MYHATGRLPHLLPPASYSDPAVFAQEQARVFRGAWRFAGTLDEIPRHGDFLTCTLGGAAVIVRNLKGEIRAFSNVCAHRHCLLKSEQHGTALELQCPYHGWRYNDAGQVSHSPGAHYFKAEGAERPALKRYRTALCGKLVFVRVDEPGPSLRHFLGDLYDVLAERFGDDYRQALAVDLDYRANWKIPTENTLEGYHAPQVHPQTFAGEPNEARSEHVLAPGHTAFATRLIPGQGPMLRRQYFRLRDALMGALGEPAAGDYRHIHVYPNLTFAFADGVSVVQAVEPVSPTRSRGVLRHFGLDRRSWPVWKRWAMAPWTWGAARLTRRIALEDAALFPAIQAGLEGSPHAGMIGRNEERIHAFQTWLVAELAPDSATIAAAAD